MHTYLHAHQPHPHALSPRNNRVVSPQIPQFLICWQLPLQVTIGTGPEFESGPFGCDSSLPTTKKEPGRMRGCYKEGRLKPLNRSAYCWCTLALVPARALKHSLCAYASTVLQALKLKLQSAPRTVIRSCCVHANAEMTDCL